MTATGIYRVEEAPEVHRGTEAGRPSGSRWVEIGHRTVVACFKPLWAGVLGSASARDKPGGFPRPGSAARLSLKEEA